MSKDFRTHRSFKPRLLGRVVQGSYFLGESTPESVGAVGAVGDGNDLKTYICTVLKFILLQGDGTQAHGGRVARS